MIDRSGRRSPALPDTVTCSSPQISPDGKRLAIGIGDPRRQRTDIWTVDLARDARTRLTFSPGRSSSPVWSPDGSRIAFAGSSPKVGLYEKSSSGIGTEKLLLEGDMEPTSWSADGRLLLYYVWNGSEGTAYDMRVLSVSPTGSPVDYVRTNADEQSGRFSPDGKYVAYTSSESGRYEIYVQTFPPGGGKWQISRSEADDPRWRKDGQELFFLTPQGRILSAPVRSGGEFQPGTPQPVVESLVNVASYDVTPDGQRFLTCTPVVDHVHLPMRLIAHWTAEAGR